MRGIRTLLVLVCVAWASTASGQPVLTTTSPLPTNLDGDGDGIYDRLEAALGSNAADRASQPESHALADGDKNGVADACEDFLDNDRDGSTDGADPGCAPLVVSVDREPGLDVFFSRATIEQGALGQGMPPQRVELAGPAVVRRGDPDGATQPVEMVAMQLAARTPAGSVTLLENPDQPSPGTVSDRGQFTMNTLLVVDGRVIRQETIKVDNPSVPFLPPVQDSRKVDKSKCYQFPGGTHCPEVPRLRIPVLKYVAKFDCGEQPSTPPPFLGAVKPGDYATKIVIHNPHGVPVEVKKKVAVGERNPRSGPISKWETFKLPPDGATEIDCPDVFRLLGLTIAEGRPLPFKNGVAVILSTKKLDVIANYTVETPKEKVEFVIEPLPAGTPTPPELRPWIGKRLKWVTLITEDVIIDEEAEIRKVLKTKFPNLADRLRIRIVGDALGVGSGIDVEAIHAQRCILVDPPELPDGVLECAAP